VPRAPFLLLLALPLLPLAPDLSAPFSHKTHAALRLKCVQCHAGAQSAERAGFPEMARCRSCHAALPEREIPAQRIYTVPDFVVFSHGRHAGEAKLDCSACHGDVAAQHALKVERSTSMKACMDCHRQYKATLVCTACHELGQ
jgi:hypothetical protein